MDTSFKIQLNTIIIKIGIEDKKDKSFNYKSVKELVIKIVLFNSNENNNNNIYGMYSRQKAGYGAMQYNPSPMMMPHGMGFPVHW